MEREPRDTDEIREDIGLPKMPSLEEWLEERETRLAKPLPPEVEEMVEGFPPTEAEMNDDDFLNTYGRGED